MTPQEIRERVDEMIRAAEEGRPIERTVALERLDQALSVVLDELERTIPGTGEPLVIGQRRLCRDLATALGMKVPA